MHRVSTSSLSSQDRTEAMQCIPRTYLHMCTSISCRPWYAIYRAQPCIQSPPLFYLSIIVVIVWRFLSGSENSRCLTYRVDRCYTVECGAKSIPGSSTTTAEFQTV
ncbi:unnamed protein product [Periconia digitata]|uniref:Uncharacterized protein n=1 Tax=Periconia digitata TaxID=1303443 RepID=A0A9W4UIX5_9PLEO|nr:unnamed protein product [Periconia digitata]